MRPRLLARLPVMHREALVHLAAIVPVGARVEAVDSPAAEAVASQVAVVVAASAVEADAAAVVRNSRPA